MREKYNLPSERNEDAKESKRLHEAEIREGGWISKPLIYGFSGLVGLGLCASIAWYVLTAIRDIKKDIGKISTSQEQIKSNYGAKDVGLEEKLNIKLKGLEYKLDIKLKGLEYSISPTITSAVEQLKGEVRQLRNDLKDTNNDIERIFENEDNLGRRVLEIEAENIPEAPEKKLEPQKPAAQAKPRENRIQKFYGLCDGFEGETYATIKNFYERKISDARWAYEKEAWAEEGIKALELTISESAEIKNVGAKTQ